MVERLDDVSQGAGTALTIAGFDPSSGAGVTADLMTLAAYGLFGTAATTALTVQSTLGVFEVEPVRPALLRAMLQRLEDDLPPCGIKIGMLGSAAHVGVVADYLAAVRTERTVVVVLDPVMRSSSGASLLASEGAAETLRAVLPFVDAVTPNLGEAAALSGLLCNTPEEMELCGRALANDFPGLHVVVTGGHLSQPADLLCDVSGLRWFQGDHVQTTSTHGTGCAFSSALLAERLSGAPWDQAVRGAKDFVTRALQTSVRRGGGNGPMALLPQLGSENHPPAAKGADHSRG